MDNKLKARANLGEQCGEQCIELDWTWRTSGLQSTHFALLRRRQRYPANPKDGVSVLDICVPAADDPQYASLKAPRIRRLDDGLAPGSNGTLCESDDPESGDRVYTISVADPGVEAEVCYYYALFVNDVLSVRPSLRASATAPGAYGFAEQLYRLLPGIYRYYDEPSPTEKGRDQLRRYLGVCGAALDYLRSRAEGLRGLHDVWGARADLLPHLARYIGWDLDLTKDEIAQRMEILFAPELYRTVGTIPSLQALVNRVTGWDCRIKEFLNNVCLSNAPETLHLWDIWSISRSGSDVSWHTPELGTMADNYDGRPAAAVDAGGSIRLFWHTGQNGGRGIWCQNPDDPGTSPYRIELCPEENPGSLLPNAGSPSVLAVDGQLWLFCESGPLGKREIRWAADLQPEEGALPHPAQNLTTYSGDHANPTAVVFGGQVWLFWQAGRRESTDIRGRCYSGGQWGTPVRITDAGRRHWAPAAVVYEELLWLFYCEDYVDTRGVMGSRLRCRTYNGQEWTAVGEPVTAGPNDESPAPVVWENEIWLFFHSRNTKGQWQIRRKTFDGKKWNSRYPVNEHPAADKEPAALVESNGSLRLFWRSQRRGYFRERSEKHNQGRGYPYLSCTVDTNNDEMLSHAKLKKEAFDNCVHYTYDTRTPGAGESNNDVWCARDMVGVYLTPDTLNAELIIRGRELVEGLIQRFLPVQTRIVFIIEPPVVLEKVYTYDFPEDYPQRIIEEQYEGILLEGGEQYDGPAEDYADALPDWIWLRAWDNSGHNSGSVDFQAEPVATRYRTWQTGLKSGG